ncbi:hypothetical protein B0H19DRAFT_1225728 [Mycena capillaripes]|nr:hypothetical protein B0H19DRAFT_1225728 [Mycena capillaripes]
MSTIAGSCRPHGIVDPVYASRFNWFPCGVFSSYYHRLLYEVNGEFPRTKVEINNFDLQFEKEVGGSRWASQGQNAQDHDGGREINIMRESSKIWRFFQIVLGGFLEQSDQSDDFRRTGRGISLRDALERWVALEPSDLEAPKRPLSLRVRQGYSADNHLLVRHLISDC